MQIYNKWEIWEANVPYLENPAKSSKRPVLIVEPDRVLVLKITSHGHSDKPKPYEYEILKWQEAGLTVESFIQCDKFIKLDIDRFTGRRYGSLMIADIIGVKQMAAYHGLNLQN